jgi:Zn finger protein HypA/HybF involved in hydrogenase expression
MAEMFDDYKERDAAIAYCPNCGERLRLVKDNDASIKAVKE